MDFCLQNRKIIIRYFPINVLLWLLDFCTLTPCWSALDRFRKWISTNSIFWSISNLNFVGCTGLHLNRQMYSYCLTSSLSKCTLLICTWFLKSLVYELDFLTWFFNLIFEFDFLSCISNWNFACYTGSKNQVWNRQKIKFKSQVQKSSSKINLVN